MNKHILFVSSFIIGSVLFVYAQGTTTPVTQSATGATTTTQAILLAEIDLYNTQVKKVGLVNYNFSFTLNSADLIDQDAYYRVMLRDKDNNVVFLQSFPDKVTIPAGKSVPVIGTLIVPQDFKGTYMVFVQVTNDKGLPLGTASAGDITLNGSVSAISIKSCKVGDDVVKTTSENINGNCVVSGKTTKNSMLFTTVYYGNIAAPSAQVKSKIVSGKAMFIIPARSEPGTYQVVSQLYDAGRPMSSPVFNTFKVEGQSAKITTIKTDKGVYAKEEIAKLSVSLKTVNIKSSEVFVTAKLETQDKVVCGEYSATAAKSSAFVLDILITRKCSLPSVTVTLTDKAGKVLDTLTTVVVTDGKEKTSTFTKINPTYAGVGALLLIVIALSSYIIYRKRTGQIIG